MVLGLLFLRFQAFGLKHVFARHSVGCLLRLGAQQDVIVDGETPASRRRVNWRLLILMAVRCRQFNFCELGHALVELLLCRLLVIEISVNGASLRRWNHDGLPGRRVA